jgi:malonate decarboxylase delta subunit
METLHFTFSGGSRCIMPTPSLLGVVSSGNLEVLIEPAALDGRCDIEVHTAAHGFDEIWKAVMTAFQERWQLTDTRIAINDMGATPAVVSLRLDQAAEAVTGAIG